MFVCFFLFEYLKVKTRVETYAIVKFNIFKLIFEMIKLNKLTHVIYLICWA